MKKRNANFFLLLLLFLTYSRAAFGANFANIPIVKTKIQFLDLYRTQWELFGVKDKLDEIIDEAMDEQTADLMWGTKAYQLATNRNGIIDKIQEAAGFKFSPVYEKFVAELEESWGDTLRKDILSYYEETNARMFFELGDNPMVQAQLRQDYDSVTSSQGAAIIKDIAGDLSEKYNVGTGLSFAALGGGILTVIGRKYLQKKLGALLLRKAANGAVGKLAGAAIPIAGWIMAAWGAWDIYSMAIGTEDAVRQQLHDMNQSMYTREIPQTYWEAMEPYVRDAYIFAYEKLQFAVDRGNELSNDPIVKELESGLGKAEKRFFADRIAVLDDALEGVNFDKENLFKYFGKNIRDASVKDFETIVLMLREGEWERLKNWIDFVGIDECCKLFTMYSKKFWTKLPPIEASLSEIENLSDSPDIQQTESKQVVSKTEVSTDKTVSSDKKSKEMPATVTGLDKTKFVMKAKESFFSICNSQWDALNLSEKLQEKIDNAINSHTQDMMWGTVEIQLRMNQDDVIEKILHTTKNYFSGNYVTFLNSVEDKWGESLQNSILEFYKRANTSLLVGQYNPMKQADIRFSSSLKQIANLFTKWINEEYSSASFDSVAGQLYNINETIYLRKLPEIYWSQIEPFVTEAFIRACQDKK
ncbi:MAG: hypothetical protein IJS40_09170 [Synergistaceae bacterium]|nr:hypothetical protein [Synergistaceae bacterium]